MPRLIHLNSLEELRAEAAAWDDLWRRSDVSLPLARAELVAQWFEQFAPDAGFHALVVEDGGHWVAALPLRGSKVLGTVQAGKLPVNSWVPGARFLLDTEGDVDGVLDLLTAHLSRLPWRVLWLDEAPVDTDAWKALEASLRRTRAPVDVLDRYSSAWLDIGHDWEAYTRSWSGTFRRNTLRLARRLAEAGEVRFEARNDLEPEAVEAWLRRGFDVEHRCWKGRNGTSVLGSGMFPYFLQQAQQLARSGQLHLAMLESCGRPIAFVYGAVGKGVFHVLKLGYDEEYAKYNPGHVLYLNLFQGLWGDPACRAVDFFGLYTEAQQHWKPSARRVGRLVFASGLVGRAVVHAHHHWWPQLRRMRRYLSGKGRNAAELPERGAPPECPATPRPPLSPIHTP